MSKILEISNQFLEYFSKFTLISIIHANLNGFILLIISQIQVLTLIFEQLILFSNRNINYIYEIHTFLVYISNPLYAIAKYQALINTRAIISLVFCLIFCFILFTIYHFKRFMKSKEEEPKENQLWAFICIFHEKYLFLVIFQYSLYFMVSNRLSDNSLNYAYTCAAVIFNLINMIFAGWLCYIGLPIMHFQFNHSMKSRIPNLINLLYKILATLLIYYYSIDFDFIKWISISFQLAYLVFSFYFVFVKFLFYSRKVQIIIGLLISNCTILTLITGLSILLEDKELINNWEFFIWLFSIPLSFKLTANILELRRNKLVITPLKDCDNEDYVIIKLIHTCDLHSKKDLKFNKNLFECVNMSSQYQNINHARKFYSISQDLTNGNDDTGLYNLMNTIYEIGINRFPNSIMIRMIYLNYLLSNNIQHIHSYISIIIISQLSQMIKQNNYFLKIHLLILHQHYNAKTNMININRKGHHHRKVNNDYDSGNNEKNSEILNIMEYNILNKKRGEIKESIQDALKEYLVFWDKFNHEDSIHSDILLLSLNAHKKYQKILQILNMIDNKKDHHDALIFARLLIYISIFLLTVCFSTIQSEKCMELLNYIQNKYQKLSCLEILTNENIYTNNNIFITISGTKEYLGQIFKCSASIQKYLGYTPQVLMAKNISIILPSFFQKRHNQYLTNFLNTGKSWVLNSIGIKPIITQDQNVMLTNIAVQAISTLEHGLLFLGILRPILSINQIIVLTYDGIIEGISECLKSLFEIENNNIQIQFLKITEGYSFLHNALNFLRFIDFVLLNFEEDSENLIKICHNYQRYAYDDSEIFDAYQMVMDFINCLGTEEELKTSIVKTKEYKKIKSFCDQYILEEIYFSIRISSTKCLNVKSYVEDQIYQNNEFLRILTIKDIKVSTGSICNSPIQRNKIHTLNEESSEFERIEINEISSLRSLDCLSKYNGYTKKTKNDIENIIHDINSAQRPHQITKLATHEYKMNTLLLKTNTRGRGDSSKTISLGKANYENGVTDSYLPFSQNLFTINTKKVITLKSPPVIDDIKISLKSSDNSNHCDIVKKRRISDTSSLSTQFTYNYIERKMDQAFDHIYISSPSKLLILSFCGYILLAIIIGIMTYKNQLTTDLNYHLNTNALYYWNLTYKKLLDLSYVIKEVYCVQNHLIPNDLWSFADLDDLLEYDIGYVSAQTSSLKSFIDNFGKSIYSLPANLKSQILGTPIRLIDTDPTTLQFGPNYTTRNIIGASYEFISTIFTIGAIKQENKFNTTSEIIYLINNVFGDMISAQSKINAILLKVIIDDYSESQSNKLMVYLILICLSIICLLILEYQSIGFFRIQHQFLENLGKLKSWKTTSIQKNIQKLLGLTKSGPLDEKLIEFKKNIEKEYKFKEKNNQKVEKHYPQTKNLKVRGSLINKTNYVKGFFGVIFLCSYISIFLANYFLTKDRDVNNQQNIQRFVEVLNRYSNISLSLSQFYTYLANQGNGTFFNKNLSSDLDTLFKARSITSDLVSLFINQDQSIEYSQFLIGNACKIIDPSMETFCMEWGSQAGENGIFAMEQWAGSRLIMLKQSFDSSNRSIEISKEIFKSPAFLEVIGIDFFIQPSAYEGLNNAIKQDIDSGINDSSKYNLDFICSLLIGSVLIILIFGYVIIRKICYEYLELKTLLRMFPIVIFLKHSYFKNFIYRTSNLILGNIKNILQFLTIQNEFQLP